MLIQKHVTSYMQGWEIGLKKTRFFWFPKNILKTSRVQFFGL